jgi:demethylsterigmatocystin 6-O-methyltransferase
MAHNPKQFAALQTVMTALQSNNWLAGFSLLDEAARAFPAGHPDKIFLVDVGGGHGHQAVQLRERYPDLSKHLVLQDLSQIVDKLPPIAGIKVVAQDFFEKQKVVGKQAHLEILGRK